MKPGRNERCSCGSGKKFKYCCGQQPSHAPSEQAASLTLQALRNAAVAAPFDPEVQFALGCALRGISLPDEALVSFRRAIHLRPGHVSALLAAAETLRELGQTREAIDLYRRALAVNPRLTDVRNMLANILLGLGQYEDALLSWQQAVQVDPHDAAAHCNLGNVLGHLGRLQESMLSSRTAIALNPTLSQAHNNLGLALATTGDFETAVASFKRAVTLNPGYVDAFNNLGNTLLDLGYLDDAIAVYRRACEIDPRNATSDRNLGNVFLHLRRLDDAGACYRAALAKKPEDGSAHLALGMVLRQQGRAAEAEACSRAALDLQPHSAEALSFQGELYADKGDFSNAQESFSRAVAMDPGLPDAWFGMVSIRKMTSEDQAWLLGVETLISRRLPLRHEIGAHYAMGKYFDDLKLYAQAFHHYRSANELTKRLQSYDAGAVTQKVNEIIETFDAESMQRGNTGAHSSQRPVFVVGMPRSGTSLAEQILASHPMVFGAGELTFWDDAYARVREQDAKTGISVNFIAELASSYLARLSAINADAPKIVDKMPGNFMSIGLIHAAFPKARIIHMTRHPLDTCLSIYFQFFLGTHAYSNDLADLAHFYREYLRIMDHWRTSLPPSVMLDVPYEALIQDQQGWSRRMTDFIGLQWDERCMNFDQTDRVVTTASKWQVRQKIHKSSAGRFKHYEEFLGPLRSLIELAATEQPHFA